MAAELKNSAVFEKKLAAEEEWIRKGVKARRTRNEGRVRALLEMREQYRLRREREQSGNVSMEVNEARRTGRVVIEAKNISFGYTPGALLVDSFSTVVMRGDRVGIVGPNGSGKTTLLKLLLGELQPETGDIKRAEGLQPLYFDQLRAELDLEKNVAENVAGGYDTVTLNGRKKHILGYLKDFLFTPDRAKMPVAHLSGGERNRLLLAKLFSRPSNLLVMDEPTNDLDVETLELLEELLDNYRGTLLLVSHDRAFLDNTVTDCFVLAGGGKVVEYAGGYSDWHGSEARKKFELSLADKQRQPAPQRPADRSGGENRKQERPRKLSFKEKRELETMPDRIAALEEEKEAIHASLSDPKIYRQGNDDPGRLARRLEELEEELEKSYNRWQELENLPA